ncbi:hypothetical protein niasHT_037605 [Heterodera trifolii]|uniref:Uncharacterized protein n=1 Tax=Heterodera trifolii TaxID=157864 RepID=A0ABD2J784_9BILA
MRLSKVQPGRTSPSPRVVLQQSFVGRASKLRDGKITPLRRNSEQINAPAVDARTFCFIFGTADGKHKFYGVKTARTGDHADIFYAHRTPKMAVAFGVADLLNLEVENIQQVRRADK